MHHPRCLDPKSQDASIPNPHRLEGGNDRCRLGGPGHCRKCPHRGQAASSASARALHDPRFKLLMRATGYAPSPRHYSEPYKVRPDTAFVTAKGTDPRMPQDVADFLWPPDERDWIERDNRWAERAAYHIAMAEGELVRELLREIFDLHGFTSWSAALTDDEIKALTDGADPRSVRPEALDFVNGKRVGGDDGG